MTEIKPLGTLTVDDALTLYERMLAEFRAKDRRLAAIPCDQRTLRTMLQMSFDTSNALFFVTYFHDKPIGFVDAVRVEKDSEQNLWYIKGSFLEKEYRGSSIGLEMITALEKQLRKKGAQRVYCTELMDEQSANEFWIEAGYSIEDGKRVKDL